MKRLSILIPLLIFCFSFLFLSPNSAFAASCSSLGGKCRLSGSCPKGNPLPGDDCFFAFTCCPLQAGNPNQIIGLHCTTNNGLEGINTALGCIVASGPNAGNDIVGTILKLATGLGGGIALLLILYGVFIVTTSAGMPDKLKAGNEIITSAIIGLVFILLSIFLVNLIGINILGIPGLS